MRFASLQNAPAFEAVSPNLRVPQAQPNRVLVAEDSAINQQVVCARLAKLGITPHVVGNGGEAVKACERIDFELILMDCQMPEMDGFAATQLIRRHEQQSGRHVPIVAMTANAMAGDRERCIAAGMDDYASKPVTLDQLRQIIERWLPQAPSMSTFRIYKPDSTR